VSLQLQIGLALITSRAAARAEPRPTASPHSCLDKS
jgi:hypothetical protein